MKSVFPDATHGHWTGGKVIGILYGIFCSTGYELSRASNPSHLSWRFPQLAFQSANQVHSQSGIRIKTMADTEIISEYHEQIRGILDRRLTLFSDSVRVVGTVRGTRGEGTVMLSGLQPAPHKAWIRSKHFHWASATLFILTPFVLVPFVVYPPNFVLLTVGLMFYLPAIWYFVRSLQRKEVAIFMNRSGVVGLDFWCNGPDAERFSEFVSAVERQIREQSVHME